MADYTDVVGRTTYPTTDPLVPEPLSNAIIQELPKHSVLLTRAGKTRMSTKSLRQPVLSALPDAYWVSGDTGLKQTTKQQWDNITFVAEELAAIVVIPDAYMADVDVPLWDEIRPMVSQALGKKIDQAGLFGVGRPSTWPNSVYEGATASGNLITPGAATDPATGKPNDLAEDVAGMGRLLSKQGFSLNGFATAPGYNWQLVGLRSMYGVPIYQPSLSENTPSTLYGYPLNEADNGGWDATKASMIGGQWDNAIVGMRQDITFQLFTEGVVSDDTGKVVVNLMQQDSKALRVVMRVGFAVANPVTTLQSDSTKRYPFAVLGPVADLS